MESLCTVPTIYLRSIVQSWHRHRLMYLVVMGRYFKVRTKTERVGGGECRSEWHWHRGRERQKERRDYNEATLFIHELLLKMEILWIPIFKNVISIFGAQHSLLRWIQATPPRDQLSVKQCGQLSNILSLVFLLNKVGRVPHINDSVLIPQANFLYCCKKT